MGRLRGRAPDGRRKRGGDGAIDWAGESRDGSGEEAIPITVGRQRSPARRNRCYWCGHDDPTGHDHVFPRSLFAPPRPANLITVPACDCHNGVFSRDEEYFRDFILSGSYGHPEARRLWREKTVGSIRRKPSYRALLAGQLQRLEFRTPAGLSLGSLVSLTGDRERLRTVLRKIARGLFYHHSGEPMGPMRLVFDQVRGDRRPPDSVADVVRTLPTYDVGHVRYWYGGAAENPAVAMGAVSFFARMMFVFGTRPDAIDDRADLPRDRRRSAGGLWLPERGSSSRS